MSLLDTRYPELDLFLQRWQRRLNGRFLSGEAGFAVAVTAPLALLVAALVSPGGGRWGLWLGLVGLSTAVYTLLRSRHRLTRSQAATWLDERTQAKGLFRAASECLERDPDPSGLLVLEEADRKKGLLTGPLAPRIPLRRWALRLLCAVALAAGSVVALTWSLPTLLPLTPASSLARGPERGSAPAAPESDSHQLSPREAAKRLFPEDERLAALAEQALASGDPGALESLLEQNADSVNRSALPPGAGGAPRGESGPQPGDPGTNPGNRANPGGGQGSPNRSSQPYLPGTAPETSTAQGSQDGSSPQDSENGGGSQPQGNGGSSRGQGSQGGAGPSGGGEQNPFGSGGAPGVGHSEQPLSVRPRTGNSDRTLTLKDPSALGLFEYVLPGSEAALPTARTLADSRRSAEAVLSKTAPPIEFENTIRDYFLSLSQEVSP